MAIFFMVSSGFREPKRVRHRMIRAPKCIRPFKAANVHQNAHLPLVERGYPKSSCPAASVQLISDGRGSQLPDISGSMTSAMVTFRVSRQPVHRAVKLSTSQADSPIMGAWIGHKHWREPANSASFSGKRSKTTASAIFLPLS